MGEVSIVELLATEYPDVAFIIPHLGSFADDWRAQLALIDHLVRHPNVYTDTSGVRRFDLLEQAVRRAGARKVLFGSDGPWLHPGVELAKVHALDLPAEDERLVLGGNLLRLIARRRPTRRRPIDAAGVRRSRPAPAADATRDPWLAGHSAYPCIGGAVVLAPGRAPQSAARDPSRRAAARRAAGFRSRYRRRCASRSRRRPG